MLALNQTLLSYFENIFINNQVVPTDKKFQNFVKYLQLPVVISTHQNPKYQNPQLAKQSGNLFKIVNKTTDAELVQSTRLKLMLIDGATSPTPFTTVNISSILPEKLKPKYGATYPNAADKNKAQTHIKALLSDAKWIKITDAYLANADWNNNKALITALVPHKALNLTIETNNFTQQNDLKTIYNHWNIIAPQFPSNIHDRYIETDKIKILLSSGLYHLSTSSSKDFTYIIELKP